MRIKIALLSLCLCVSASLRSNAIGTADVISFTQGVESNKSVTVTTYGTYAPNLKIDNARKPFGGGIAAIYPVDGIERFSDNVIAQHTFVGLRADYLAGDLFAGSVGGGLKAHVQLFHHDFLPFTVAGGLFPLSGSGDRNVSIGTFYGGGVQTTFLQFGTAPEGKEKPGSLGGLVAYERWSIYDTQIFHGGLTLGWKF